MGFECANGSFSFVATVHVWWDELKCAFVGFFYEKFVGRADFVVQDLLFDKDVAGFEPSHDFVVCRNAMMVSLWPWSGMVGPGLHWHQRDTPT